MARKRRRLENSSTTAANTTNSEESQVTTTGSTSLSSHEMTISTTTSSWNSDSTISQGQGSQPPVELSSELDISLTPLSPPCQPTSITFPKRAFSGIQRAFNPRRYSEFAWLEYSQRKDAAFCCPCQWFGSHCIGRGRPESAFTVTGFTNWKHATGSKGALQLHSNCSSLLVC